MYSAVEKEIKTTTKNKASASYFSETLNICYVFMFSTMAPNNVTMNIINRLSPIGNLRLMAGLSEI